MINRKDPQHNWVSFMELILKCKDGITVTDKINYNTYFKISPQMHMDYIQTKGPGNELVYYIYHTGAAYLSGEEYGQNIIIQKDAKAIVTTVSPNSIYECKDDEFAYQEEYTQVDENAYLTYITDDIIAYEGARYKQKNTFKLSSKAHLIYSDMIGPGWSEKDKDYTFEWIKFKSEFYVDDKLFNLDNLRVEPKELEINALGYMDEFLYMPSIFVFDERVNEKLILELRQYIKQTIKFDHKIGISKLDGNAFVIRALTKMEEDGNALVVICVNWIRKHLWNMVEINFKKY